MRQLKITSSIIPTPKNVTVLEAGSHNGDAKRLIQEALLEEVRNGDKDAIPKLVDSCEDLIFSIIKRYEHLIEGNTSLSIEKMVEVGRATLTMLAEKELNATSRESFFRFGAWWVQQAVIQMVSLGSL